MTAGLTGLVAAAHTPFGADGSIALDVIEKQADHLLRFDIHTVFVGGSTGESHSLSLQERLALAERWSEVVKGCALRMVVHVGSNSLEDARAMAAQAEVLGAAAIAALAPSYFRPRTVDALVDCCFQIAGAAPMLPFYFYDIPALTGVHLSMPDFLEAAADRVPTLAGIKFTNMDLAAYQRCLACRSGRFDVPWGVDEALLAALALGARGAVGSSYNFAGPLYHRLLAAFQAGDMATARLEQLRSVELIHLLARFGYMAAAKAVMGMLGVPVGAPRLPNEALRPGQEGQLQRDLEALGFFQWLEEPATSAH